MSDNANEADNNSNNTANTIKGGNKRPKPILLFSGVGYKPTGSHIDYYTPIVDDSGFLKAGAQLEQAYLQSNKLMSEDEFVKAHGGKEKVYSDFKIPYSEDELKILLENYRREPATRRATEIISEFALGERTELAMDTTKAYADQKRQDEQIRALNEDPALTDYLDDLATIDEKVNATDRFTELLESGVTFGRSVLVIQRDADGIPERLIPLASIRLGKIFCDAATWELLGCEYRDYKGEKRILDVEDIIHFEYADRHMTPNTKGMGISLAEPTMYTALSLRTAYEIAIPEIRRSKWAPFYIAQFPEVESQELLDKIAAGIEPGKSQVWGKGQIMIHKIDLNNTNIKELYDTIEMSQKEIFRSFGIALVFAFQDEQNRSTAQFSSNLMRVTKLSKIRTMLRNVLEPQWYNKNLKALIARNQKRQQEQYLRQPPGLMQYEEQGVVTALEANASMNLQNKPPIADTVAKTTADSGITLDVSGSDLPFRPRMKFVDKKVDTFLELSAAALGWKNAGVLDDEEAAELAQLEQFTERIRARKAEKELNAQATAMTQAQMPPGAGPETPGAQPTSPTAGQNPIPTMTTFGGQRVQGGSGSSSGSLAEEHQDEIDAVEIRRKLKAASNEKLRETIGLEIMRQLRELHDNT